MMHAPEMSPTLDDALRALDGATVNGVMSAAQLAAVRGFLEQLDDMRDVSAVVLDPAQAAHMEGAYLEGVRCADESGHVLVVSLPAFLRLCPPAAPACSAAPRRSGWGRLQRYAVPFMLACLAGAWWAAATGQTVAMMCWGLAATAWALAGISAPQSTMKESK